MTRLIDPIHLFNEMGQSVLAEAHLIDRIAKLEEENAELKRRCRTLAQRVKFLSEETAK